VTDHQSVLVCRRRTTLQMMNRYSSGRS